jgi:cell division protein FtsB
MWFIFAGLLLLIVWSYYIREPLDLSPYEMVQEQAGVIQQLHETIVGVTLTEASIDALQAENDQTTDQINQLQQNMPSKEPQQQYPAE